MDKNFSIYKYISSLTKSDTLPGTMYYNSECDISNTDKAHLFNHFFSVFTIDFSLHATTSSSTSCSNTLEDICILPKDVYEVLISLDPNKAQGIDCLSPKI